MTGDQRLTADAIADSAGISREHVFAEVPPEAKAQLVRKLQQSGARIAFVGDGINDAPALEQADLGVAVASASDVAREAADMILLNSEIRAVPEALALAQACHQIHGLDLHYNKTLRTDDAVTFTLSEVDEGCACSMLTDDADWKSQEWKLRPHVLPLLAKTVSEIFKRYRKGFVFSAEWASEPANKTVMISIDDLNSAITNGRIANNTKYTVT